MARDDETAAPLPKVDVAGLPTLDPISSGLAPFIYFDPASTVGFNGTIINVTLEAVTHLISDDRSNHTGRAVVAHLRMGLGAAEELRARLDIIINSLKVPEGKLPQ